MIRTRFFSIAAIVAVGLVLAVLLVPGGAFAQEGSTDGDPTGQPGATAIGGMIMQGWHHDQMHANAGEHVAGQMGHALMGAGHMTNHANITGTMTGMHAGMMSSGMGHMLGTDAEHQQHMAGIDTCLGDGEDAAEHAATCTYQPPTTGE